MALGVGPASGAPAEQGPIFSALGGENEVGSGDADGRGSAAMIFDDGQLCFGLNVKDIGVPTGAHIHRGLPNENGPVVLALIAPSAGDPGTSSACIPIGADLAADILAHQNHYYVNVHTAEFPGGAVRGQLFERRP